MQQRTGVGEGGRRIRRTRDDIPVVYYVFDLLYADGYDLMQAGLQERKQLLASILASNDLVRYSCLLYTSHCRSHHHRRRRF